MPLAYPDPPLADAVVALRPWRRTDLPAVIEASRDPYIPKVTSVPAPITKGAGERWLERQDVRSRSGLGISLAIADPADDEAVGAVVLMHRGGGVYGLGYWLLPPARGRGLASRAVALVVEWALAHQFDDRRVTKLLQRADIAIEELAQELRLRSVLAEELDRDVPKPLLKVARLVDGRCAPFEGIARKGEALVQNTSEEAEPVTVTKEDADGASEKALQNGTLSARFEAPTELYSVPCDFGGQGAGPLGTPRLDPEQEAEPVTVTKEDADGASEKALQNGTLSARFEAPTELYSVPCDFGGQGAGPLGTPRRDPEQEAEPVTVTKEDADGASEKALQNGTLSARFEAPTELYSVPCDFGGQGAGPLGTPRRDPEQADEALTEPKERR
jgi:GNAT superfamily N-acetyltransferase